MRAEKFAASRGSTRWRKATGHPLLERLDAHPGRRYASPVTTDLPTAREALPPITRLLQLAADGDRAALDQVYASLYPDLKRVARARLRQQGRGDSMGTTTLLHESFIRLVNAAELRLVDRRHFFAYAARTMRNIIIDSAREYLADRRGGGAAHETLGGDAALQIADTSNSEELIRVSEALLELQKIDPELAELVDMRYFGGYTESEIAELQEVTERTIRRRWDKARAWLYVALNDGPPEG
jgi:RNA polymerase sigma factor (TIGR02999 family)